MDQKIDINSRMLQNCRWANDAVHIESLVYSICRTQYSVPARILFVQVHWGLPYVGVIYKKFETDADAGEDSILFWDRIKCIIKAAACDTSKSLELEMGMSTSLRGRASVCVLNIRMFAQCEPCLAKV